MSRTTFVAEKESLKIFWHNQEVQAKRAENWYLVSGSIQIIVHCQPNHID